MDFNISSPVRKFRCADATPTTGECEENEKRNRKKKCLVNAAQSLKIKQFLTTFGTFVLRFGALGLCAGI